LVPWFYRLDGERGSMGCTSYPPTPHTWISLPSTEKASRVSSGEKERAFRKEPGWAMWGGLLQPGRVLGPEDMATIAVGEDQPSPTGRAENQGIRRAAPQQLEMVHVVG